MLQSFTLHDGVTLAYRLDGPIDGIPVIFLHGYACTGLDWEAAASSVADEYRTLVFDFRGHSRSASSSSEITLDILVNDLRELISALALHRPILIGHSMGGMVALEYTLRYPDDVRALVMAEAFPHLHSVTEVFGLPEDPVNDPYGYGSVIDRQTPEAVVQRVRQQMSEGVARLPASLFESLLTFDRRSGLGKVSVPTLLLLGDRRKFTEQDRGDLINRLGYALMPNLEVALVPSHHFLMLEQPELTLSLLRRFLEPMSNTADK